MNQGRRNFLKFSLIGGLTLIAIKAFGPLFSSFFTSGSLSKQPKRLGSAEKNMTLKGFRMVESEDGLEFFSKEGRKVLTLHEDGTLEV